MQLPVGAGLEGWTVVWAGTRATVRLGAVVGGGGGGGTVVGGTVVDVVLVVVVPKYHRGPVGSPPGAGLFADAASA